MSTTTNTEKNVGIHIFNKLNTIKNLGLCNFQKDLQEIENLLQKREEIQDQIQKLDTELTQREDEFLRYYTKEMGNSSESIQNKDEQAKATLDFLDKTGCVHMKFSDFIKIQTMINTYPSY